MATLEKIIKETDPAVAKKKGASKNPGEGSFVAGVSNTHPIQVIHKSLVERYARYLFW
jgi:hypothetical protein